MPEIDAGEYLIEIMREMGPFQSNGMGLVVTPWAEMKAFAAAMRVDLEPWEFTLLRRMCAAYLSGYQTGREPLSIPPMERGKEDD